MPQISNFWQFALQALVLVGTVLWAGSAITTEMAVLRTEITYLKSNIAKLEIVTDRLADKISIVERRTQ